MKILIDGDGCPVTRQVERIAKKRNIELLVFCDTSHMMESDYGEVIVVSKGADAVDFALINRTSKGDLVVTQDYGLAAMALGKGARSIHPTGMWYDRSNMDRLLFTRHLAKEERRKSSHFHGKGPAKRKKEDDEAFIDSLERGLENWDDEN